ncbi:uncharacterized protein LOC126890270 [Diabrotica virgifera virgifera]|uniref:Retrotransposon gag domain-containing protein n=1 Tax=Diabrotica virgifera virgifera TaxID=50390 RepID=A0ABM5KY16_DIAVI|nr:uncharacterized protein LOC126890270 [Diabrotica virgifera virgifera]
MECFKPPEAFNVQEPHGWLKWKQRFEIFMLASEKNTAAEKIKIALLVNIIGESCLDVYNTFPNCKTSKLEDVLSCFDDHFLPKTNTTMETFKFNSIHQKEGQTIDSFLTELKKQASNCAFICENDQCKASYADRMIRDKLVLGIHDRQVQRHLLREPAMSLEKMQEYCRSIEVTMQHVELLNKTEEEPQEVLALRYGRPEGRTNKKNEKCSRCAYAHEPRKCPAYNQTCRICQRRGHFAEMCFFKDQNNSVQRRVSEVTEAQETSIDTDLEYIVHALSLTLPITKEKKLIVMFC